MFQDVAPGFELDMSRAVGPGHGIYGRDEARRFWGEFAASWESIRVEPHQFIEAGDLLVVPWTVHVRGRDGIEVVSRPTFVWTIRDGAIERISMYQERQDRALDARARSRPRSRRAPHPRYDRQRVCALPTAAARPAEQAAAVDAPPRPASDVPGPRLPRPLQSWLGVVRPFESRLALRRRYGTVFRSNDVIVGRRSSTSPTAS